MLLPEPLLQLVQFSAVVPVSPFPLQTELAVLLAGLWNNTKWKVYINKSVTLPKCKLLVTPRTCTVPVKCKLTVTRNSILDPRKLRVSSLESCASSFENRGSSFELRVSSFESSALSFESRKQRTNRSIKFSYNVTLIEEKTSLHVMELTFDRRHDSTRDSVHHRTATRLQQRFGFS